MPSPSEPAIPDVIGMMRATVEDLQQRLTAAEARQHDYHQHDPTCSHRITERALHDTGDERLEQQPCDCWLSTGGT